jgi:hypothetical protein
LWLGPCWGAWLILETNVTLPSYDGGPAHVSHVIKKTHLRYTIHKPRSEWACYNYVKAQLGHICKHQLKVPMFFHLNLAKGIIVQFCGSLKRTFQGGLKKLI